MKAKELDRRLQGDLFESLSRIITKAPITLDKKIYTVGFFMGGYIKAAALIKAHEGKTTALVTAKTILHEGLQDGMASMDESTEEVDLSSDKS